MDIMNEWMNLLSAMILFYLLACLPEGHNAVQEMLQAALEPRLLQQEDARTNRHTDTRERMIANTWERNRELRHRTIAKWPHSCTLPASRALTSSHLESSYSCVPPAQPVLSQFPAPLHAAFFELRLFCHTAPLEFGDLLKGTSAEVAAEREHIVSLSNSGFGLVTSQLQDCFSTNDLYTFQKHDWISILSSHLL